MTLQSLKKLQTTQLSTTVATIKSRPLLFACTWITLCLFGNSSLCQACQIDTEPHGSASAQDRWGRLTSSSAEDVWQELKEKREKAKLARQKKRQDRKERRSEEETRKQWQATKSNPANPADVAQQAQLTQPTRPSSAVDQPPASTSVATVFSHHPVEKKTTAPAPLSRPSQPRPQAQKTYHPPQTPLAATPAPWVAAKSTRPLTIQPQLTTPAPATPTLSAVSSSPKSTDTQPMLATRPFPQQTAPPPSLPQSSSAPAKLSVTDASENSSQYAIRSLKDIHPFQNHRPQTLAPNLLPSLTASPSVQNRMPEILPISHTTYEPRTFPEYTQTWQAPNWSHHPLYFEDVALERYGHTRQPFVQPLVSWVRFGVQLAGLPYQMFMDPANEKAYPLGHYRPGDKAPKLRYRIPLNAKAALGTVGFYTGLSLLLL